MLHGRLSMNRQNQCIDVFHEPRKIVLKIDEGSGIFALNLFRYSSLPSVDPIYRRADQGIFFRTEARALFF